MESLRPRRRGASCRIEVLAKGREIAPHGDLVIRESLTGGCEMVFEMDAGSVRPPGLGDEVTVAMTPSMGGGTTTIRLWCVEVVLDETRQHPVAGVRAIDPLAFCARGLQFLSYAGRVSVQQLALKVLGTQPFRPGVSPPSKGTAKVIPLEWLLQCQETGMSFLQRTAASVGQVVYWDRDAIACASIAEGPADQGRPVSLRFGDGLEGQRLVHRPDYDSQTLIWTDPASRRTNRFTFRGRNAGPSSLSRRVTGVAKPLPLVEAGIGFERRRFLRGADVASRNRAGPPCRACRWKRRHGG